MSPYPNLRMLCLSRCDAASRPCLWLAANLLNLSQRTFLKSITTVGALYLADANGFTFTIFETELILVISRQPVQTGEGTP